MPGGKLKSALLAHQANSAKKAAEAKSQNARKAKEESMKHTSKEKKKLKLAAKMRAQHEVVKANQAQKVDLKTHITPDTSMSQVEENKKHDEGSTPRSDSNIRYGSTKPTIPFSPTDTILLLGEANFSFSLSLLSLPENHRPKPNQILATSYDDEKTCYSKYPDAKDIVGKLRKNGIRVEFGVDAGNLEKCKAVGKGRWSKVVFNFPHVGAGITDQDRNILTNQHLLLRTFRSVHDVLTVGPARPKSASIKRKRTNDDDLNDGDDNDSHILTDDDDFDRLDEGIDFQSHHSSINVNTKSFEPPNQAGTILVTLLSQPPYTLWSLPKLVTKPPPLCPGTKLPQPRYTLIRSFKFDPSVYEGYAHRRTIGWREGLSKDSNEEIVGRNGEARTWEFGRREEWAGDINGSGSNELKGKSKGKGMGGGKVVGKRRKVGEGKR